MPTAQGDDWREVAKQVYREAQAELEEWTTESQDHLTEFYKEELREALLDLKQAVLQNREADALACVDEIALYLLELRRRARGEHEDQD